MEVLLEAIAQGKSSRIQILAASILSNIGGTFSWTGEPYTAPWLLKRAGLTSTCSRNMIKNIDWLDPCLQVIVMIIHHCMWHSYASQVETFC